MWWILNTYNDTEVGILRWTRREREQFLPYPSMCNFRCKRSTLVPNQESSLFPPGGGRGESILYLLTRFLSNGFDYVKLSVTQAATQSSLPPSPGSSPRVTQQGPFVSLDSYFFPTFVLVTVLIEDFLPFHLMADKLIYRVDVQI